MGYQSGKLFRLFVADDETPIVVKGMNTVDADDSFAVTQTPVFDSATPIATLGDPEGTVSVAGLYDPTDPGQIAVRAAARDRVAIDLEVRHDGTNGYARPFLVTGRTWGANADGSPQAQGFSLVPAGDATIVGTGPLP